MITDKRYKQAQGFNTLLVVLCWVVGIAYVVSTLT